MTDVKGSSSARTVTVEVVAGGLGLSVEGNIDGPLEEAHFCHPTGLAVLGGDALVVCQFHDAAIRRLDGVLGPPWQVLEQTITGVVTAAIPVVPKVVARVIVQYSRVVGVTTIAAAGALSTRDSEVTGLSGIAVDETDPASGPQLILTQRLKSHRVLSLNLRTRALSTIAGNGAGAGYRDGPALSAVTPSPMGVVVACHGHHILCRF
jgi:hypothetical protein